MDQRLNNAAHILITHHAKDEMHPLPGIILIQCFAQRLRTVWIMRAVQNNFRLPSNTLQPSRPDGIGNAQMQRQLINALVLLGYQLSRHDSHAAVFNLMLARQLNLILRAVYIAGMQHKPLPIHRALDFLAVKSFTVQIYGRILKHSEADDGT